MHHGFNCTLTSAALDGRTWVNTAKLAQENQIKDAEDPGRGSNHLDPVFCGFALTFQSIVLQAIVHVHVF